MSFKQINCMEFLKDIALPQSIEHYRLVVLITAISSIIFLPYIGFVLGSITLSFRYRIQARNNNNVQMLAFAYQLAEVPLKTRSVLIFLGIIPGLSLVFSFAQMLQSTPAISVTLAGFGFLCALGGLWLLYSYKETFRIQGILTSYQTLLKAQKEKRESAITLEKYEGENTQTYVRSGTYGIILLLIGIFLFSAAFALTANPSSWQETNSIFSVLISLSVWIKFMVMLAVAAGSTGFGIMYFIVSKISNGEGESLAALKKMSMRFSVIGLIVLPLLLLAQVSSVSDEAMSGPLYSLTGVGLVLLFLAAHFLYGYQRSALRHSAAGGFFVFLLAASITLATDSLAIGTATREQAVILSTQHEKSLEDLQASLGVTLVTFTGEGIYNAKCSACHLFDQKKVGPPYFETIPKYEGKKDELISFILNPMKKDPNYPPMSNQGLKPAEADSIASYLLRRVASSLPRAVK
jgi:cytochrome c551/c552